MLNTILEVVQEDTKTYNITIAKNGSPLDITGWKLFFTVKHNFSDLDNAALISKTITVPSSIDAQNGVGSIVLSITDTSIPVSNNYKYDMKFQSPDMLTRKTFSWGYFKVVPTATIRTS
jgi:hypothetical protein